MGLGRVGTLSRPGSVLGPAAYAASVQVDVLTIFPALIEGYVNASILGRAQAAQLLEVRTHDLRDATSDVHRTVDDSPYGGGAGMVMKPEPIFETIRRVEPPRPLFYLSPAGRRLDQPYAAELATLDGFSLLCGRYEGVDERVRDELVDGEISIGDYVLAGGELAALVVIEAVARLIPGVLGNDASPEEESFSRGLLEYPHYTRPADFEGRTIPDELRSGNHQLIEDWRHAQSLARTIRHRPDLIAARGGVSASERSLLERFDLAAVVSGSEEPKP